MTKDNSENQELIRHAFEKGINLFDTADRYDHGWNEKIIGEAVKDFRKQIYIATKVGHQFADDGTGWKWAPSKQHILTAVDRSLSRLQTDYIDLYQLHGGTIEDPIDDIIEAFERLVEAGKIRYYGISSIRPNVIRKYSEKSSITSVMMQYSLLDRRPEEECFELLKENNIGVLARGTLAKGVLADKPPLETLEFDITEVDRLQKKLRADNIPIAKALHFVLQNSAVTSAVVGMRNHDQLKGVIKGYTSDVSREIIEEVKRVLEPKIYSAHR